MEIKTHIRRTLVAEPGALPVETISGQPAVDTTSLPSTVCLACDWRGDSYKVRNMAGSQACPRCENEDFLNSIEYETNEVGAVYELHSTVEKAVLINVVGNEDIHSNFFAELELADESYIPNALVVDVVAPDGVDFKMSSKGSMKYTPNQLEHGIKPVKVKIQNESTEQHFILRLVVGPDRSAFSGVDEG